MRPEDDPVFAAFLAEQRADYAKTIGPRLEEIARLELLVLAGGEGAGEALALLERAAHSLAGSGATFGFAALGRAAHALEELANALVASGAALDDDAQDRLQRAAGALQAASAPG